MYVVGLTGGIGSGKTTVSDQLAQWGVPVIDTDVIAREVVAPGQPALAAIVALLGTACLTAQGTLNRRYVREHVFADPIKRQQLEAILHPRIAQATVQQLDALATSRQAEGLSASPTAPYSVVVIPLLTETSGMRRLLNRIAVVDVPEELQIQRVMARDQVDETHARRILAAQANRAQRLAIADDVINNSGVREALIEQLKELHQKYLYLAIQTT